MAGEIKLRINHRSQFRLSGIRVCFCRGKKIYNYFQNYFAAGEGVGFEQRTYINDTTTCTYHLNDVLFYSFV